MNKKVTNVRPKQDAVKPKTVTQKLERLAKINPAVNELIEMFDLEISL